MKSQEILVNGQVLMESALPFYRSADKDATEQIINCFRYGKYKNVESLGYCRLPRIAPNRDTNISDTIRTIKY